MRGAQSGRFKTGDRSKYMPERLLERYHEALNDARLLEQREDIAVNEGRKADLLKRTERGDTTDTMTKLRTLLKSYKRSKAKKNDSAASEALKEIFSIIEEGYDDHKAWQEYDRAVALGMKLRESERKYLLEKQHMVTRDEVMTLMAAISAAIKRHVSEKAVLDALSGELGRLASIGSGQSDQGPNSN